MPATFIGAALASGANPLTPRAMPDAITARREIKMSLVIDLLPFFTIWFKKHKERLKKCQAQKWLKNQAVRPFVMLP
jgi:hypothetical protein